MPWSEVQDAYVEAPITTPLYSAPEAGRGSTSLPEQGDSKTSAKQGRLNVERMYVSSRRTPKKKRTKTQALIRNVACLPEGTAKCTMDTEHKIFYKKDKRHKRSGLMLSTLVSATIESSSQPLMKLIDSTNIFLSHSASRSTKSPLKESCSQLHVQAASFFESHDEWYRGAKH